MSRVKKALVLVHGYLGGSQQWQEQASAFSTRYNVITPDLPGFGYNSHLLAPDSISGFAEFLRNELDRLDIRSCYLLGHSMGGMVVQEMVRLIPERVEKLVLYGTGAIGVMPGRFETIEVSREKLQHDGIANSALRIAEKWFVSGKHAAGFQICADTAQMASLQAGLAALTAMQKWSGVATLENIHVPTLVLWGDQDQSYRWPLPEQLWREIPQANLSVVGGCSHAVHLEKPALFNAILADFLSNCQNFHS